MPEAKTYSSVPFNTENFQWEYQRDNGQFIIFYLSFAQLYGLQQAQIQAKDCGNFATIIRYFVPQSANILYILVPCQ